MSILSATSKEGTPAAADSLDGQSLSPSTILPGLKEHHDSIANDIDGHIYADVGGFYTTFFEDKPWSTAAKQMVQSAKKHSLGLGQALQSRDSFAAWLLQFQFTLSRETSTRYVCSGEQLRTPALSQNPLALARPNGCGRDDTGWADVLVVGEFCPDGLYRTGLLNLCGHARAVFSHQPDRLFLHGFHLCGGTLELWVFDRSGIYSSEAFDVAENPDRFATIIVGYTLMDDVELGVGELIKEDGLGKYILCGGDDTAGVERLYLGEPTIFERTNKNVVSDGLTCYRARSSASELWEYAIKLKWSPAGEKSEAKMLRLVKEKSPWGVLRLLHHRAVCDTDALHQGLMIGKPRELQRDAAGAASGREIESVLDHTVETPGAGDPVDNKVLDCTVVSPLGKSLHRFESVPELLEALRDGVRAHRSLYQGGEILHQDVCPGNIIIPSSSGSARRGAMDPRGVLIDLDVAKEVSEPWKQFEGIGTPPFKAIGVLQAYLPNNPHTYRHDLESFFYTFLFLATCERPVPPGENQLHLPPGTVLSQWFHGRPVDQVRRKTNDMDAANFDRITAEFTPEFQRLTGLATTLRGILFPTRDGGLWTETDMTVAGTNALYDSIISAFDAAVTGFASL